MEGLKLSTSGFLDDLRSEVRQEDDRRAEANLRLGKAKLRAERLAAQLAPIFPVVAGATKSQAGLDAWADSWAHQILVAGLSDLELLAGLENVVATMASAGNPPLSFPLFLIACRPHSHLTGMDAEARRAHPFLLTRDRSKDPGWCSSRDTALAQIRAMGYPLKPPPK